MATDFLVKQGRVMGGVRLVTDADVAHQTDLTNIRQTGTTASQAISAGTYFYLNDILVRAKVDIADGATFTLNTNYEVVTAGGLNELNDAINRGSVKVLANGTKTYSQGLNELWGLLDLTKVNAKSILMKGTECFVPYQITNNLIIFTTTVINSSNTLSVYTYQIQSSGSKMSRIVNGAYTDLSSNVMPGDLEFFY